MFKNANSIKNTNFSINKRSLRVIFGIPGVIFYDSRITVDSILLSARLSKKSAHCPCCGKSSKTVHSKYKRYLKDLPVTCRRVCIIVVMRKFKCNNSKCPQSVFSEQHPLLTKKHSRKTTRTTEYLRKFLVEVSSRKGEYLTDISSIKQSSSTCLRIVNSIEVPQDKNLTTIGIDDWAYRKGLSYGTIIVNALDHRPVELLQSRSTDDVVEWLKKQDYLMHVTRDRASSYSKAISTGAPRAIQIADKFHIIKNLSDYITEEVRKQYKTIQSNFISQNKEYYYQDVNMTTPATNKEVENQDITRIKEKIKVMDTRREALFNEVHRLKDAGFSQRSIAKVLGIDRKTVNNYFGQDVLQQKGSSCRNNYEDFMDDIIKCCNKGLSIKNIFKIIEKRGFNGKQSAFYEWFNVSFQDYKYKGIKTLEQCKLTADQTVVHFNDISPRKLAIHVANPQWGISKKTGECSKSHMIAEQIIKSSALLTEMRKAYISFKEVLNGNDDSNLLHWITEHKCTTIRKLKTFINGIRHDIEAVKNAIKYKWTNGLVEGHVNRLKNKKREMYGRASFDLLRKKVILSKLG